jgi:hypothetical protein
MQGDGYMLIKCMSVFSVFLLISILISACRKEEDSGLESSLQLSLAEASDQYLKLEVINRTRNEVVINGLFGLGYVQSPIKYEIESKAIPSKSLGASVGMPVLVKVEDYRLRLPGDGVYGAIFQKEEFRMMHGLEKGGCYRVKAHYKPIDTTYTQVELNSELQHFCF